MATRITLNELKRLVKQIVKEESTGITIGDLANNWKKYFPQARNRDEIRFVINSKDVKSIKYMYPKGEEYAGFLFHKGDDGEYTRIYGFTAPVPYDNEKAYKVL